MFFLTVFTKHLPLDRCKYKLLGSRAPNSQASASFLDEKSGVLFYTQINKNVVGCWNSKNFPNYSVYTNTLVVSDNVNKVYN